MNNVRYLTGEEILYLHYQIIEQTTGTHGVRDTNLFLSTIERPKTVAFGEEQFVTIFEKAAVYLESFASYQIFVDGNKRTALAGTVRFLYANDVIFNAPNEEVEIFVMRAARKEVSLQEIAAWLKDNSRTTKQG